MNNIKIIECEATRHEWDLIHDENGHIATQLHSYGSRYKNTTFVLCESCVKGFKRTDFKLTGPKYHDYYLPLIQPTKASDEINISVEVFLFILNRI